MANTPSEYDLFTRLFNEVVVKHGGNIFIQTRGTGVMAINAYVDAFEKIFEYWENNEGSEFDPLIELQQIVQYKNMAEEVMELRGRQNQQHRVAFFNKMKALFDGELFFNTWDIFDDDDPIVDEIFDFISCPENGEYKYPKDSRRKGNVYLMKNQISGYYKIGFTSKKPEYREKTLQSQEPEVELIWSTEAHISLERHLHLLFADKRVRGEWFSLSEEDVNQIMSMTN